MAMLDNDTLMAIMPDATSAMIKMRLKTLKSWIDREFDMVVGQPSGTLDIRQFSLEVCRDLQRKLSRKGSSSVSFKSTTQTDVKDGIGTFNGKISNWKRSKRKFEAGLAQLKNENGIPLSYVIRDDGEREAAITAGGFAAQLYEAPMSGPTFLQDNFRVYQTLIQWTSGGTAETYVDSYQSTQHGRHVWLAMVNTYEGADARNANIQETRTLLESLKYEKDSHNFTFDDYCTKTITYNNDLTRYGANVDGRSQVSKFLTGITRTDLQPIKINILRDERCKADIFQAVSDFKDVYQTLVKSGNATQTRAERRVASQSRDSTQSTRFGRGGGGRGGRGPRDSTARGGRGGGRTARGERGRGRGNGGRGGQRSGSNYIAQATLDLLSPRERAMILLGRTAIEAQGDSNVSTRSVSSASSITTEPAAATHSTALVVAAPTTGSGASGLFGQQSSGGRNRNASATNTTTENQYYLDHDGIRRLCPTTTSDKRVIGKQMKIDQPMNYAARKRCEIDTRADTFCAGQTFLLHEATGMVVDVGGFHPSLPVVKDVPIGTVITAYDTPEGETIILSVHQALFFGASMEHSLCQPNQFREHGLIVDTTPKQYTNGKSLHGMYIPDQELHIPFELFGCLSYFPTRLPTPDEIDTCRWAHLSSDGEWDPYSNHFASSERATMSHLTEHPRYGRFPTRPDSDTYDADGFNIDGRYQGSVSTLVPPHTPENIDTMICSANKIKATAGDRFIGATSSKTHRSTVDAAELAARWGTSLSTASQTLRTTTQRGYRYLHGNLDRRFRTRQNQLRRNLLRTAVYSDTLFSDTKSVRGYTCAQLFVTAEGFADGNVMTSKSDAYLQLNDFCREHGIPDPLVTDMAGEETEGEWKRVVKENLIKQRTTEAYSPWQNKCEKEIGELKRHCSRISHRARVPAKLWCFTWFYTLKIRQHIARSTANDRTPYESLKGETPDISALIEFDYYSYVKVRLPTGFPNDNWILARWLGPAESVGQGLTYYVIKDNGQVIARSTVRPLLPEEWTSEVEKAARLTFDKNLMEHIGEYADDEIQVVQNDEMEQPLGKMEDDAMESQALPTANAPTNDVNAGPDMLVGAEIYLPHGDRNEIAKVMGRKRNSDGLYIGRKHQNPILDSRVFTIRFPDGDEMDVSYNTIAEHLFSQVDEEGNQYQLFKEIIGHRKNKQAVEKADQYRTKNGKQAKKQTTAGWDLEVEWADGTSSWLPLKQLKETNSVETAQYARDNRIIEEPAFDWWAMHVLKRRTRLIKMSQSRHKRSGYKFGIRIPRSTTEALEIDAENGNTDWYDAIMKEMLNVRIAFNVLKRGDNAPPGYKKIPLSMIFDIKLDFTKKARLVAGGHRTDPPTSMTYSSVVSRESVRIAFTIAALNGLDVIMSDVGNAYLNAKTSEKVYGIAGPEFGDDDVGKVCVIVRALYGLKSSGAAWRSHFANDLRDMGFTSTLADPDVWLRPAIKKNGFKYYEYILVYVDDQLTISENAAQITDQLTSDYKYRLKDVGPPTKYLGARIGKQQLPDGSFAWSMSAEEYLKKAIPEIERKFGNIVNLFGKSQLDTPAPTDFHPEIDQSAFLDDDGAWLYQSYIGILRWAVELGRVELNHTAATMAKFSTAPREGHLRAVIRTFAYCKKHITSMIVFDPTPRNFAGITWDGVDWAEFYPDAVTEGEGIPPNAPEPRGNPVHLTMFCDASHATDLVTRRSTTGILFFLNGAPIKWYSKRQNTIESSTFGSEFVALKIAVEMNDGLRYKLRMFGIPLDGPTNGFCDNESVVRNTTVPESTLQKKHNSIAYHKCRESVALGAIRIKHERGKFNCSDILTKFLPAPAHVQCSRCIMYNRR